MTMNNTKKPINNDRVIKVVRDVNDRKGIIGGSDIGGVLGLSTYKSEYDVYLDYIGQPKEVTEVQQAIFDMGHELEGFIAKQIERVYKLKLKSTKYAYVHPVCVQLICHPDRLVTGLVDGKRIGVEIKSSSAYDSKRWGDADSDEIPMDYLCQCHSYIMTNVCDEVWLFRFSNNRLTRYIITRDDEIEDNILKQVITWIDKVEHGYVPQITDYRTATKVFSTNTEDDIEADDDITESVIEWREIQKEIKEREMQADILKAKIVEYMKDKKVLKNKEGDKLATYSKMVRQTFDSKAFQKDYPEEYVKYAKETAYMVLR